MDTVSPHADNGNIPLLYCPACTRNLPATTKYYYRNRSRNSGFQTYCKQCLSGIDPDIPIEEIPEGYKQCTGLCGRVLPATTENFHLDKRGKHGLHTKCKQCRSNLNEVERERKKLYDAQWHKDNSEHCAEVTRLYRQTERGTISKRALAHNRRARKRNAIGTHTVEELSQQFQRQKGKCYYCHKKLDKGRDSWNGDHVIPLSKGGTNYIDNIVIVCPSCNFKKGTKLPHEWPEGGRLL